MERFYFRLLNCSLIALIVLIKMWVCDSLAHDSINPMNNAWLSELKSGKGLCCSGSDAQRLDDPDWEAPGQGNNKTKHYRVRLDVSNDMGMVKMDWVEVPDDAVVEQPSKDGVARAWPLRGVNGVTVRCFQVGTMG